VKRLLLAVLAALLASAATASSQETQVRSVLFTLDANPPGTAIALEGSERILGPTPLLIPAPISGTYRLSVIEPGFESARGRVVFTARDGGLALAEVDNGLSIQRAIRSTFVPGLGQISAGETSRGWGYFGTTLALAIGTIVAEADFLDERDKVRQLSGPGTGLSQEEADARTIARLAASNDQDAAYRRRNAFAIATAAVWGLSIVDAAFFIPPFEARLMKPDLLTIEAHRKTATRRAIRSAVLPGLGQFYGGAPARGFVYLGAAAAASAVAVAAHLDYQEENDDAAFLLERLRIEERSGDPDAAARTRAEYRSTLGAQDDAYDLRSQALAAAGAVWAVSILDALLFDEDGVGDGRAASDGPAGDGGLRLACRLRPDGARVGLVLRY
jgi:hypothetical protein